MRRILFSSTVYGGLQRPRLDAVGADVPLVGGAALDRSDAGSRAVGPGSGGPGGGSTDLAGGCTGVLTITWGIAAGA